MARRLTLISAALLASCGGGANQAPGAEPPPPPPPPPLADCGAQGCAQHAAIYAGFSGPSSCGFKPSPTVANVGGCIGLAADGIFVVGFHSDFARIDYVDQAQSGSLLYLHSSRADGLNFDETTGNWTGTFDADGLVDIDFHLTGGARGPQPDPGGGARVQRLSITDDTLPVAERSGDFLARLNDESLAAEVRVTPTTFSIRTHPGDIHPPCVRNGTLRPIHTSGRMLEAQLEAGCDWPAMNGLLAVFNPGSGSDIEGALWLSGPGEHHFFSLSRI